MRHLLPQNLLSLAKACPTPLYVVGGSVRDFLANLPPKNNVWDWDICAPMPAETFISIAKQCRFTVLSVYKRTGTVKLKDEQGIDYEYSCFRSDKYVRGVHTPVETFFTGDITLDARRRDFTANAVYYDIKKDAFVDPLNGIAAIKEKRLSTVAPADKVFGEDGLRLMRLCRQAATLGFTPDTECVNGAKANVSLIEDISPERIFTELTAILQADEKYGVNNGHYCGLKWLDEIGVLQKILPELHAGKNMAQRPDFHKYDVLEHSFRAAMYAPKQWRLAALLHDVGKPFCELRDGTSYAHPDEGARIAGEILTRLKAPKRCITQTQTLISLHMYDLDGKVGENKLRRFFAAHYPHLTPLMAIKQADFSACKDNLSVAPTVQKWQTLLAKLQAENAPLTVKQLALSGKDLADAGFPAPLLSDILQGLLAHTVCNPQDNEKARLLKLAKSLYLK